MPKRLNVITLRGFLAVAAAAALSGCTNMETTLLQPASATTASPPSVEAAASPAPATPMTREKASTDCWMKYEKEGRGLSLDQRLPLVEKCTAEKLKAAR